MSEERVKRRKSGDIDLAMRIKSHLRHLEKSRVTKISDNGELRHHPAPAINGMP